MTPDEKEKVRKVLRYLIDERERLLAEQDELAREHVLAGGRVDAFRRTDAELEQDRRIEEIAERLGMRGPT